MVKDISRHSHQKIYTYMANKHEKWCLNIIYQGTALKQSWDSTTYLLEWSKSRTQTKPNAAEDVEEWELLLTVTGNKKWYRHFGEYNSFTMLCHCCTTKWISYMCTYVPFLSDVWLSHPSIPHLHLDHHRALLSSCATTAGSLAACFATWCISVQLQFSSAQSLSRMNSFVTPWITALPKPPCSSPTPPGVHPKPTAH